MITTARCRLHARQTGPKDGPAVLFVNSLGTDLRVWEALLPLLPASWRPIRYDKRGHGLSDCPPAPYTMDDHAADLVGLMDALAVDRAVLVGLSIGGMIAQHLAARHPERVRALVLCDTAARIGSTALWDDRIAAIEAGGIDAIAEQILGRWFSPGFRRDHPGRVALWRHMLTRQPVEGYLGSCAALRDTDLTETTRRLRLPVLGLVGADDGSTPPAVVQATVGLIPGSRFHVIGDAGHLPCVERPDAVAALLIPFVEGLAP